MKTIHPIIQLWLLTAIAAGSAYGAMPLVEFRGASQGCENGYSSMGGGANRSWPAADSGWKTNPFNWSYCIFVEFNPVSQSFRLSGTKSFDESEGIGSAVFGIYLTRWDWSNGRVHARSYPSGTAEARVSIDFPSVNELDRTQTFLVSTSSVGARNGNWYALDGSIAVSISAKAQQETQSKSEIFYSVSRDLRRNPPDSSISETVQIPFQILSPRYCTLDERSADITQFSGSPENTLAFMKKVVCVGLIPATNNGANGDWSNRRSRLLPLVHRLEEMATLASPGPVRDLLLTKVRGFYSWAYSTFNGELTRQAATMRELSRFLDDSRYPSSFRNLLEVLKRDLTNMEARNQSVSQLIEALGERREISNNPDFLEYLAGIESVLSEPGLITQEQVQGLIDQARAGAQRLQAESIELIRERDEYRAKGA